MSIRRNSKSALFLMEIIIMILFFAVATGICVNLFAKAAIMRDRSSDLTNGMIQVQSIAETFKQYNGDITKVNEKLGGAIENDCFVLYFDENWNKNDIKDSYTYKAEITNIKLDTNNLISSVVSISRISNSEGAELCRLNVAKYKS